MLVEIKVPALAESVTDATLLEWQKQAGEFVKRGDNLIDLETDKVTLEVTAPDNGILKEIVQQEGTTVLADEVLAIIETDVQMPADATEPKIEKKAPATPVPTPINTPIPGPAARKLLQEQALKVTDIHGTGKQGRITKGDIQNHIKQTAETPIAPKQESSERQDRTVPMTRIRLRTAERLVAAQQENATLTTFNEVNLFSVKKLRAKLQPVFETKYGYRLGFMPFFVQASINALKEFPVINASVNNKDIVYHDYYDIGVAVSSDRGLVVPVMRDADQLSFAGIEGKIRELGDKARSSTLTLDDLIGGTFTITNGGTFGSMLSTPILNPPQSAILGMHAIQDRPVVENGQIVIRPVMYIALSYDHRIIDGRDAVSFLASVKKQLEDPALLFLGEI